ncbi:MAG: 3-dehydroquinate synthase [Bacteroidales bacterium]
MIYTQSESEIIFTNNIQQDIAAFFDSSKSKIFILADTNTEKYCFSLIEKIVGRKAEKVVLPAGEEFKNIESVVKVWNFLNNNGADRKSVLINLGGGVICDLGGFAASTFKRGIDFIHIPTTLLAQVDASVGGKTGIDFNSFKNEIGCFSFPKKVIIDCQFLKTLDTENLLSGFAEMVKHAFISGEEYLNDLQMLHFENNTIDFDFLLTLVKHSVQIKEKIVLADPMENGLRKVLNFGHTVGHAIESYFMGTPNEILHGRAVAYGMAVELYLSLAKAGFSQQKFKQSYNYLNKTYGKAAIGKHDFDEIIKLMLHDKKNESDNINFTLLNDFGKPVFNQIIKADEIKSALAYYIDN